MDERFISITINHLLGLNPVLRLPALLQKLSLDGFSEAWMDPKFKEKRVKVLESCRDFIQNTILAGLEPDNPQKWQALTLVESELGKEGNRHANIQNLENVEKSITGNVNLEFPHQVEIVKTTAKAACGLSLVDALASINPQVSNSFKTSFQDWKLPLEENLVKVTEAQGQLRRLNKELAKERREPLTPVQKRVRIELPTPETPVVEVSERIKGRPQSAFDKDGFPLLDPAILHVQPTRHCEDIRCVGVRYGPPRVKKGYTPVYNITIDIGLHFSNNKNVGKWLNSVEEKFALYKHDENCLVQPHAANGYLYYYCPDKNVEEFKKAMRIRFMPRTNSANTSPRNSTSQKSAIRGVIAEAFDANGFPKLIDNPAMVRKPTRHCDNPQCVFVRHGPPTKLLGYVSMYRITTLLNYHPLTNGDFRAWCDRNFSSFDLYGDKESNLLYPSGPQVYKHVYCPTKRVENVIHSFAAHFGLTVPEKPWNRSESPPSKVVRQPSPEIEMTPRTTNPKRLTTQNSQSSVAVTVTPSGSQKHVTDSQLSLDVQPGTKATQRDAFARDLLVLI